MTPAHHTAFMTLKEAIIQALILCYPDPARRYIVYMDVSDDVCGAQLSQEHDGTEFPISFPSNTFTKHIGNGVPLNRKPLLNGVITFKELTS